MVETIESMEKGYVLFNGTYYFAMGSHGKTVMTMDINEAHIFDDVFLAKREQIKRSNQLSGFAKYLYFPKDGKIFKIRHSKKRVFPLEKKKEIFEKGNCKCYLCGKDLDFVKFTVDHVQPYSKGGSNDISNLLPSCESCNLLKSELYEKMAQIIMYQMEQNNDSDYKMNCMRKWLGEMVAMQ